MTELGNALKAAREENGLSLDDLQRLTKIQKRYLVGIEKGNYDMMPGKFYVRAFIKQYAEAVGLEPEEIFEQFKNEIPSVREEELPEQLSRVQSKKTITPTQSKVLESLPKVLLVVFVIGIAVLIWVLVSKYLAPDNKLGSGSDTEEHVKIEENEDSPLKTEDADKKKENQKNDDSKKEDQNEEPVPNKTQAITAVESSGKNTTYELKDTDVFKLKVASTGETWVSIKDGTGKTHFSGILKENESQEFDLTNQEKVEIIIGKATETEFFVNDELVPFEIPPAERVSQNITITFTKSE